MYFYFPLKPPTHSSPQLLTFHEVNQLMFPTINPVTEIKVKSQENPNETKGKTHHSENLETHITIISWLNVCPKVQILLLKVCF